MGEPFVPKFGGFSFKNKRIATNAPSDSSKVIASKDHNDGRKNDNDNGPRTSPSHHKDDEDRAKKRRRVINHEYDASEPTTVKPLDLYTSDRQGDRKNSEYGYLHRYDVPAYHRIGARYVVGCKDDMRLDAAGENDKSVTLVHRSQQLGNRHQKGLSGSKEKLKEDSVQFIAPSSKTASFIDIQENFLSFDTLRNESHAGENDKPAAGSAIPDYRQLDEFRSDPKDSTFPLTESEMTEVFYRGRNAELSFATKVDPSNTKAWMALAVHQSKMIRPEAEVQDFTSSERRTLANLRLAILGEALRHVVTTDLDYEHLLLMWIKEGTIVWESSKVTEKWKEIFNKTPFSSMLWAAYLDRIEEDRSFARYDDRKKVYFKSLSSLQKTCQSASGLERSQIHKIQLDIALRLTHCIQAAGFDELAIAIWQALLEFYHLSPGTLNDVSFDVRLDAFQVFWDSDHPRIGEVGAKGWKHSLADAQTFRDSAVQAGVHYQEPARSWKEFSEDEAILCKKLWLPAAVTDDGAADDPYRFVMFSDMKEIFLLLDSTIDKSTVLAGFLQFLGLPAIMGMDTLADPAITMTDKRLPVNPVDLNIDGFVNADTDINALKVQNSQGTNLNLLNDAFSYWPTADTSSQSNLLRFVDLVLETLMADSPTDDNLAEYYIGFRLRFFPNEAAKAAKRVLKKRPNSLRMYNAFAVCEAKQGRGDKALEVWKTAISMHVTLDAAAQVDVILLWHTLFQTQIRDGNDQKAAQALLNFPNSLLDLQQTEISATRHLKSTRALREGFDRMLLARNWSYAVLYADCLAWLEYFTSEYNLSNAGNIYIEFSRHLEHAKNTSTLELLFQNEAYLIETHIARKRPYKPSSVLATIERFLHIYPDNTIFLTLHTQLQQQDRLRNLARTDTNPIPLTNSLAQHSTHIATELRRTTVSAHAGSTQHTIRAAFRRALADVSLAKHNLTVWVAGLHFEHRRYCVDRSPTQYAVAKKFFYEGLRVLPCSKFWAVYGMHLLKLDEAECQQVYRVMEERGLRIRRDVGGLELDG